MTTATVVVCVYTEKRWDDIVAAVESVAAQDVAPVETLVVVDHNPALLGRARRPSSPACGCWPTRTSRACRAPATPRSPRPRGDVVVFLDDDARARPGWLAALLEPYEDATVQAVGGVAHPRWPTWPNGGRRPNVLPGAQPARRRRHRRARLDRRLHLHRPADRAGRGAQPHGLQHVVPPRGVRAGRRVRRGDRPHRQEPARLRGDRALHPRPAGLRPRGREDPDRVRAARRGRPPRQPRPRRVGLPAAPQLGRGPVQGGGVAARRPDDALSTERDYVGQGAPRGGRCASCGSGA